LFSKGVNIVTTYRVVHATFDGLDLQVYKVDSFSGVLYSLGSVCVAGVHCWGISLG